MLEQDSLDDLLAVAAARQVSVVAGGVFNSGLLIDPRPAATYDYLPAAPALIERAQALEAARCLRGAAARGRDPVPALRIPGRGRDRGRPQPAGVEDTLAMMRFRSRPSSGRELKRRGLVREDAPTPG